MEAFGFGVCFCGFPAPAKRGSAVLSSSCLRETPSLQ